MSALVTSPSINSYTIPLVAQNQTLTITLGGVNYSMRVYWCNPSQTWNFDLYDQSGTLILGGVPMVTGCNLLRQFAYLGIGGSLVVLSNGQDPLAAPTLTNLGTDAQLMYVVTT
jgi:hypothetical protein